MPYDRFLIAPLNSGLEKNRKPWMISDDAFERLRNAYVYRGYVRKRFGARPLNENVTQQSELQEFTRLRVYLGDTNGAGTIAGNVPGAVYKVGQMFSIGNDFFTVTTAGAAAMITTSTTAVIHTYNTATGAYNITLSNPNTATYFYPTEPVMGFARYETNAINDEPTYAFDTQFAYQRSAGAWARLTAETVPGDALWAGTNTEFFWHTNYRGTDADDNILFVTNYNASDNIRYWDGSIWTTLRPAYLAAANHFIETARIIIPFKDRLLLLNTVESVTAVNHAYVNRCRYCANGSPFAANAWREDIAGQGDAIDAPTKQAIISAHLFKDRLIVFFERSTWEIVYTGNQLVPFKWQEINSELGSESTFSIVPFDRVILGIGDVGIHACTGTNVERIDAKIPDDIFAYHNDNDGVQRVQGIRDYFVEQVYWAIPSSPESLSVFPTKVLVYNYELNAWAYNDDTITAFGYYQIQNDLTWEDITEQWQNMAMTWNAGLFEAQFRYVIAGNQQGFTFLVDPDVTTNSISLQITNVHVAVGTGNLVLTIIDHNLELDDYIDIQDLVGTVGIIVNGIYRVGTVLDVDRIEIEDTQGLGALLGNYLGRGTATRVSQIDILTKQYNFYTNRGTNLYLAHVDFNVDKTVNGQITVDAYVSSSQRSFLTDGEQTGALLGSGILETSRYATILFEIEQDRLWHKMFFQSEGECVQLRLYLTEDQVTNRNISGSDFQLNGFIISAKPTYEL